MIGASFRPLAVWPYPQTGDRRSRWTFKAPWSNTLNLLDREVNQLDGGAVIIAAGFAERDLRQDGWPRSGAKVPPHPGVEISFDSRHGRLVYATDVCEWWEHNVRSIALGLEALRAVDRYGVTRRGEQYAGWKELPSGIVAGSGIATEDDAWQILFKAAERNPDGAASYDLTDIYRAAAKATHPDTGGDGERFAQVQAAYEFLKGRAA